MKRSAGIVPFRIRNGTPEVYLIHMGGPYWKNKERSWSVVKGEIEEGEDLFAAARREFHEETGQSVEGELIDLGEIKGSGKILRVWAVRAEPSTRIASNTFTIEWPPGSGRQATFPEADRAAWFDLERAREVLAAYQEPLVDRLEEALRRRGIIPPR
ncbi:NUDIX domain-containing protein [Nitratifractor sp.]